MNGYFDKDKIKNSLTIEQIFEFLEVWGGEPEYRGEDTIICTTICHNVEGGSRKLYYYNSTRLFVCYTHCGSFDIFELLIKIKKEQNIQFEMYDAMQYIVQYFNIDGEKEEEKKDSKDWEIFKRYENIVDSEILMPPKLKEYSKIILTRFIYPRILSWEKEGITKEILHKNLIGYFPGEEVITIPHFDINNRLIGIRQRFLDSERVEKYGKYRPLLINKILYTHPLSMNLYNLNNSKENIKKAKTALILEGEKSCLQYQSMYGRENDITVAVCGGMVSGYHIAILLQLGVQEIIIGFDRDYTDYKDEKFKTFKNKCLKLNKKYGKSVKFTFLIDKNFILKLKDSPTDGGKEKFEYLMKNRIIL